MKEITNVNLLYDIAEYSMTGTFLFVGVCLLNFMDSFFTFLINILSIFYVNYSIILLKAIEQEIQMN